MMTHPFSTTITSSLALLFLCTTFHVEAFTFDTRIGATIVQHQSTGTPITWGQPPIRIRFELGTDAYDDAAASAMGAWNAVVPLLLPDQSAPNVVRWARDGEIDVGTSAATTTKTYGLRNGHWMVVQADILLNPQMCWSVYRGSLRIVQCGRSISYLLDVERVVLHELGHLLGLEHPDEGNQDVSAIMNGTISNLDNLAVDDEAGIRFLYSPTPSPAQAQHLAQHGGSGGGCVMGNGEHPDQLIYLLAALAMIYMARILCGIIRLVK